MFLIIGVILTVCGAIFASVPDVGTVNNECIQYYVPIKLAKLNTDGDTDLRLAFELVTADGFRRFQINLRPVAGVVSSATNISTISMDKGRNNFGVQVQVDNWKRYEGRLMDDPRSLVSGHVIDGHFSGFVNTIDDTYYLDPASDYFEGCMSQKFNTIVYKSGDVGHANETRCVERSGLVRRAHSLPAGFHQNLGKKSHRLRRANRQTTSTSFLCDLRVICDFRWYRHVAFRNATYGSELVVSLLRRVDQIFRALDLDGDGRSENVGFFLRYLDIYIDPVLPGYEDIEHWHAPRFFDEFRSYDFTGVCAGLLLTYRQFYDNGQTDLPTIPKTNIGSLEQGICSEYVPPKSPVIFQDDYGDYIGNALPVNFMARNRLATASSIIVQTAHQLGHLFGARDDIEMKDGRCQPVINDLSLNFIMAYPLVSTNSEPNFGWSPCSQVAIETFLRGLEQLGRPCLKPCNDPSCLRDRWNAVGSDRGGGLQLRPRELLDDEETTAMPRATDVMEISMETEVTTKLPVEETTIPETRTVYVEPSTPEVKTTTTTTTATTVTTTTTTASTILSTDATDKSNGLNRGCLIVVVLSQLIAVVVVGGHSSFRLSV